MKIFLISALALVSATSFAAAQSKEPRALIMTDDDTFPAFIVASSAKNLRYREKETSTVFKNLRLASINVYFLEPAEFTEAIGLYRSRDYQAALASFKVCAATYSKVDEVPGNYSSLATFYQMECHRKLGDLESLMSMVEAFSPGPLLREQHLAQIEIYKVFWDAVRTKAWPRIVAIASDTDWVERKLSGGLRAQVAYCTGLALEGVNEPIKALNAYNGSFVADFAASEVLTRKAALACLRILKTHEDVALAIKLFGTEDYDENSNGALLINEGIALVKLWGKSLGGGEKLPDEYKMFLKYEKK